MSRGVIAGCLISGVALVVSAQADSGTFRYSMLCEQSDVKATDYSVYGRAATGVFSFRSPKQTPEWLRFEVKAAVNGETLPRFVLSNPVTTVDEASSWTLVYTNARARAELEFRPTKAIFRLTLHRPSPLAVQEIDLGTGSFSDADQLFDPSVRFMPYHEFPTAEPCEIKPGLASPPPWVMSYRREGREGCWSVALEPDADKIDFTTFEHQPAGNGVLSWKIRYPRVDAASGDFTAPPLVFRFGDADFFAALARHVADIRADGKMIVPDRRLPDWHTDRIACTWRFQRGEPRREQATEANCEAYVKMLEDNGIGFGTLIIDDFWGEKHGLWEADPKKWNDLRGFIDRQHAKGRHVLLWICADGEGLPDDEHIGYCWNPESPAFRRRLKEAAHRMLSADPGCYNADGVKFDFTSSYVGDCRGRGLRNVGCGFIRERFRVLGEALLAVKPDAVLDFQCTNPYFTHTLTMLRLNDYFGVPEHGLAEMRLRARIAAICAPGAVIDTDHISFSEFPYDGGLDFFRECRTFGVESLYLGPAEMKNGALLEILRESNGKRGCR